LVVGACRAGIFFFFFEKSRTGIGVSAE
jgi:hypothetical protein